MENWILPLTILPSVGLLILSTTNLSVALSGELDRMLHQVDSVQEIIQKKLHQLKLLSWALTTLYICASLLALDGLIGAIMQYELAGKVNVFWTALFAFAIICLFTATTLLILFAFRAIDIKQQQFER